MRTKWSQWLRPNSPEPCFRRVFSIHKYYIPLNDIDVGLLVSLPEQQTKSVGEKPDTLEGTLGWLLQDTHWILSKEFTRRAADLGITAAQWRVLSNLYRSDAPTQTELSDIIGMEKAPLGRLLDKLEDSGLIQRRSDPDDRRVRRVYMRPAALDRLAPMREVAEEVFSNALEGLTKAEIATFLKTLEQMKANLSQDK